MIRKVHAFHAVALGPVKSFNRLVLGVMFAVWTCLACSLSAGAQIVINELMYNPYEPWGVTNKTEYVELRNVGLSPVDLSNYRFDNGIDYRFDAGTFIASNGYLVVCEDIFAFTNAYPGVLNVVGNFSGSLKNSGERVTLSVLSNDTWITVDTIKYVDVGAADGDGPSLELINPGFAFLDNHYPGTWSSSVPILSSRGTPGTTNSTYNPTPPPAIGEVKHEPPLPPEGSAVKITCIAGAALGGVPRLTLYYRKEQGKPADGFINTNAWQTAGMWDNGYGGDSVADDTEYTVYVPPKGSLDQMNDGDIMEFRILAMDDGGFTNLSPYEAWSGVVSQRLSYLCKFGEDTGFTGEYKTYHVLLTEYNKSATGWGIDVRPVISAFLLDCTIITSDGDIFYNSGLRLRGSTRYAGYGPYHVTFPEGQTDEGFVDRNFTYDTPLAECFGHTVANSLGYGATGSEYVLARLYFNNKTNMLQARCEKVDRAYIDRRYPDDPGNLYYANGSGQGPGPFYKGSLLYSADINTYMIPGVEGYGYGADIVNTNTAYYEVQDLTLRLTRPQEVIATNLPQVFDCRQWARQYANFVCLDNREYGMTCPIYVCGDEFRPYRRGADGKFLIFPWDLDSILNSSTAAVWAWQSSTPVRKFLFSMPTLPYYVGDCMDIMTNTLSPENFTRICDSLGSELTPSTRTTWSNTVDAQRSGILAKIWTNLTVTISGAVSQGRLSAVVTGSLINMSGRASQAYVQYLNVNGNQIAWTPWGIDASIQTTWAAWATNSFVLSNTVNTVNIQEIGGKNDGQYDLMRTLSLDVIVRSSYSSRSGAVSGNTTWNGVNVITSDVTVNSGATLTVDPGSVLLINAGARLIVTSGTLQLNGTNGNPVYIYPSDGNTAWAVRAEGASAFITAAYGKFKGGSFAGNNGGGVDLHRCTISDFTKNSFTNTPLAVSECLLEKMTDCGVEVVNAPASTVISRTTVRNSLGAGSVDGIRATGSSLGLATNCLFYSLSGNGVEANLSGPGFTVCQSLMYACDAGIDASAGTAITAHNNTIAHCAVGIRGMQQTILNTIAWSNTLGVSSGPPVAMNSDVSLDGTNLYNGAGNLNRNPWFRDSVARDFRLQPISPCLGTASDGGNMGASYPVGANPASPSGLYLTNITSSQVELFWQDNSGDEEEYFEIERSDDSQSWVRVGTTVSDSTNWIDTTPDQNESYYYRIRAGHGRGVSLYGYEEPWVRTAYSNTTQVLIDSLRITEIMYNPTASGSDDMMDFIELKNISGGQLDLSGAWFEDGIAFTFTNGTKLDAGAFFVIAANAVTFQSRYPETNWNGVYTGNLADGGELITIRDASSNRIVAVEYDDRDPWYPITDGNGYSLVLEDTANSTNASAWRASSFIKGSPGIDDPASTYSTILINEILTHTDPPMVDSIELYNAGANPVNIQNWYLSDNFANLKQYPITTSISIPAGGYYTFYETNSFGTNLVSGGFLLSELGETLYLSSASGTNLTSYRASQQFEACSNGISMGRYYRSDGDMDFVAMSNRTFDATNSCPRVGPVVINEVMYNPGAGGKEYVELYNISGANVPLFNGTNGWKLQNGFDYQFAVGTVISNGEYVLLTGTDPAVFREVYGLTGATPRVFGPWSGELDNNRDAVELYQPGTPETNGVVGWYRIDKVNYRDNAPWPSLADNGGASLERGVASAYGNDPANWLAATLGGTPGAANNTSALTSAGFLKASSWGYEANYTTNIVLTVYPPSTNTVLVYYAVSGTAGAGTEYSMANGVVTFWPYDTTKTIALGLMDDSTVNEPDETVIITVTNVTGGARIGGNKVHTFSIVDTDNATIPAPTVAPVGGIFVDSVNVSISSTVPGAEIYYTLNGAIPTIADNVYTGTFGLAYSAQVKARAYVGSYCSSSVASVTFVEQAPELVASDDAWFGRIAKGTDDASEWRWLMNTNSPFVPHSGSFSSITMPGFRFDGAEIPEGVTVTNAYIQFTAYNVYGGDIDFKITGEKTNYSQSFKTGAGNLLSFRSKTTSEVHWTPPHWSLAGEAGSGQRTPNLMSIVNEVINTPGWVASNPITFFMITNAPPDTNVYVYTYEGDRYKAATLYVFWERPVVTNYYLTAYTNGVGTITGGNVSVGTNNVHVELTAEAGQYHNFDKWTGALGPTTNNPLDVLMDGDKVIQGNFDPDLAANNTPHWWLAHYYPDGTNDFDATEASDTDTDGFTAAQEYLAGTDPTNTASALIMTAAAGGGSGTGMQLFWQGVPGKYYSVFSSTNLLIPIAWHEEPRTSNVAGDPSGTNVFDDTTPPPMPDGVLHYRVEVQLE